MRYGKASRISLILPLFKTANSLRGLAQQKKASSLLRRIRGRASRGKLRRRNYCCSTMQATQTQQLLLTGQQLAKLVRLKQQVSHPTSLTVTPRMQPLDPFLLSYGRSFS
jgi:hypothetical protein